VKKARETPTIGEEEETYRRKRENETRKKEIEGERGPCLRKQGMMKSKQRAVAFVL